MRLNNVNISYKERQHVIFIESNKKNWLLRESGKWPEKEEVNQCPPSRVTYSAHLGNIHEDASLTTIF